jgi:hypothetical protein
VHFLQVRSVEVREHEDVEQPGAGSGTERVETLAQPTLELIGAHDPETIVPEWQQERQQAGRPLI